MLLAHPEVALRSCEDCAKWCYRENGELVRDRKGDPMRRPPGTPTPCVTCPKKNPVEAKQFEISARNMQAIMVYRQIKATGGACLTEREKHDAILLSNMGIIERIMTQHESNRLVDGISREICSLFTVKHTLTRGVSP